MHDIEHHASLVYMVISRRSCGCLHFTCDFKDPAAERCLQCLIGRCPFCRGIRHSGTEESESDEHVHGLEAAVAELSARSTANAAVISQLNSDITSLSEWLSHLLCTPCLQLVFWCVLSS